MRGSRGSRGQGGPLENENLSNLNSKIIANMDIPLENFFGSAHGTCSNVVLSSINFLITLLNFGTMKMLLQFQFS